MQVNSFTLSGKQIWLDKETRVGLVNSIILRSLPAGCNGLMVQCGEYTVPVDSALQMLNQLELYALDCYNVTQSHIASVKGLLTKEEVNSYNYNTGYRNSSISCYKFKIR